jgi:hypothetical protein
MKAGLSLRVLGVLAVAAASVLMSCSDDVASPSDDYDKTEMFKVRFVSWTVGNVYADIEMLFSVEAFGKGSKPFALGPVDWTNPVFLDRCYKTADGKHYRVATTVKAGGLKTVSAGLDWGGRIYLTGEQMAGNPYFHSSTDNFAFEVSPGGYIMTP